MHRINIAFSAAFRSSRWRTSISSASVLHASPPKHFSSGGSNEVEKPTAPSSQDVSKKMYDKQAASWARTEPRFLSDFTGRPVVFDMLAGELAGGDKTVLDVGCGEGYCARKVVEFGAKMVVGCDVSQEMIDGAKKTLGGDDRFHFYTSDADNLLELLKEHSGEIGIDSGEFDVAIAVFLFNYLTSHDTEAAIAQIYHALKPGGIFVFSVPHPSLLLCHGGAYRYLNAEGKGYYSARNEILLGEMSAIDGTKVNVMSVHKTIGDYIDAVHAAGFQIVEIQEPGVTEELLALHPEFFKSVQDRPLHLVFKLKKP